MKCLIEKRFIKINFLIIFLLLYLSGISFTEEIKIKGPIISIAPLSFDLGEVEEGTPVTHTFTIKNLGEEDLKIEKVQPG
jgi:hypothetical protein